MISFQSDYEEGCIPEILTALTSTNLEQTTGYGVDYHCQNATKLIRKACKAPKANVHLLVGGTQANLTVIDAALRPYQGTICADTGHINGHETGAVEATGHKCIALPSIDGKITAAQAEKAILDQKNSSSAEHLVQPGLIYISYPTECGTLYTKKELMDMYAVAKKYHVYLFIDGARLGYGLCSKACDLTLADIAKYSDVFYIGGTKVGALFGEAVVITNNELKPDFRYMMKQKGAMLAKGRLLGIQFEELFKNNKYLEVSQNAIDCAEALQKALEEKGYEFAYTPETNQLFPILTNKKIKSLQKHFNVGPYSEVDSTHSVVRFVTSWATPMENVQELIKHL